MAAQGWRLFPLASRSKKPSIKEWQNRATSDPAQLAVWERENPGCNWGLATGQKSGVVVLDVDGHEGKKSFDALTDGKIPQTRTVATASGGHFYYRPPEGGLRNSASKLAPCLDIRGDGGYVVVPPSIHPTGRAYIWKQELPLLPFPEEWAARLRKPNLPTVSGDDRAGVIREGQRNTTLASLGGTMRRRGMAPAAIEAALLAENAQRCNPPLPDAEVRTIAQSVSRYPTSAPIEAAPAESAGHAARVELPVVDVPEVPDVDAVPAYPSECIDGDYVGDLTHALADGTAIPPQFIRENAKTILGALTDDKVGYVGEEDMHSRQYNMNVSTHPESGKGVSWRRTGQNNTGVLNSLLFDTATTQPLVEIIDGTRLGSGEYMVKVVKEHPICLARYDEISELFAKDRAQGSTLDQKFLTLFDSNSASTGSFKNKEYVAENIHLSVIGDTTHSAFTIAFAGRGSGGNGLLSRFVFAYGDKLPVEGDWPAIDGAAVTEALAKIRGSLEILKTDLSRGWGGRFVPKEDPKAAAQRHEFFAWLQAQDRRYTGRLEAHMKRDLIARALFFSDNTITSTMMDRGIAWARHQLEIRQVLWPEDAGNPVERMERKILDVLHKRLEKVLKDHPDLNIHTATIVAGLSDRDLTKLCNVDREGSGGRETYRRAINALSLGSREIERVGKNRKGSAIWGLVKS